MVFLVEKTFVPCQDTRGLLELAAGNGRFCGRCGRHKPFVEDCLILQWRLCRGRCLLCHRLLHILHSFPFPRCGPKSHD